MTKTKEETSDQWIRKIRKQQVEEMKGMTDKERSAYFLSKYKQAQKQVREIRREQVLIRLTQDERNRLEKEAKENNLTVSAWIRNRVLDKKSPLDTLAERLDRIESLLQKRTSGKKAR